MCFCLLSKTCLFCVNQTCRVQSKRWKSSLSPV
ncbi:hypothetical protein AB205_0086990 [Aquarana catesbeiana]|uniref:Uncharacterized protein n=1 Tax=Aquarana catesbeiana TaxID=8400 RepID=A0A2G9RVU6_AQUCT|nr:hypothetical protein AB205_0086990 [Aquarana catesbeiana]